MGREEFTDTTKREIADRAGHECSFPTCTNRVTSFDSVTNSTINTGEAAHIYSAAKNGPRGQGGLNPEELRHPGNGILLCRTHAKIIDHKKGATYPPETLLSYKDLQEARITKEVQGLYSPIGWIHQLNILDGLIFKNNQKVTLSKLNLFYGNNETGKTCLADLIQGIFSWDKLKKWKEVTPHFNYQLTYLNPKPIDLKVTLKQPLAFSINGKSTPFFPSFARVIRIGPIYKSNNQDDLTWISNCLKLPKEFVLNLPKEIHRFKYAHIGNLKWIERDDRKDLKLDCDGSPPGFFLSQLSGRENERVIIEFATAAARFLGKHRPVILIFDGCPFIIFDSFFEFYSHHLLDPENQFQTIMCLPTRGFDLNKVLWNGWEVVRFRSTDDGTVLTQNIR